MILSAVFDIHDRYSHAAILVAWAVYTAMTGTTFLVKYAKLRRKHELVIGIIQAALSLLFLGLYIAQLVMWRRYGQ